MAPLYSPANEADRNGTNPSQNFHNVEDDDFPMKRTIAAIGVLVLALSTPTAFADTRSEQRQAYKASLEKFKSDIQTFQQKRKAIDEAFRSAVKKAQEDAKAALATATTVDAKNAAKLKRTQAIAAAVTARDAARVALGTPPVRPPAPTPKPTPSS